MTPESLEEAGLDEDEVLTIESYMDIVQPHIDPTTGEFNFQDLSQQEIRRLMSMVSTDREATLVSFQINPALDQDAQIALARNLEDYLHEEFEGDGVEVYVSGNASMSKDSQDLMNRDTRVLMTAAFLFVMLILYLTFRRVSDIFLPLFVIALAIMWLMGLMGWVGIPYTTMSVAILPLMLGINIAYVIHILSRYYEERETGKDPFVSATTSVKTVGVAVFLTALTTVIGFASFTITDMPPMRDFGVICMVGIIFSFALSLTLLPAIVVLRDRRKATDKLEKHLEKMRQRRREARYGLLTDKVLVRTSLAAYHHHWIIMGMLAAFIIFAGVAIFFVDTGADLRNFFPRDMPSRIASEKVTEYFGPQSSDVILVKGDITEPENLKAVQEMEEAIVADSRNKPDQDDYYSREGIFSLADMVAQASGGQIPDSREQVQRVLDQPQVQAQAAGIVSEDGDYTTVMLRSGWPETEDETRLKAEILQEKVEELEKESDLEAVPTGMTVLISDILGNLLPTQLKTSGLALLLCVLVLVVVFRSFSYGIATILVVVFGIAVELIMLFVLGWPLDFFTVTISALLIGIGVDFGIHVTHRFREELKAKQASIEDSIKATVLHVGRALVAAAFTTAGVFAILGLSSMVPLRRFGWTIAVGLIAALVGAILVLPSLLAIIAKGSEKRNNTPAESA